MKTNRNVLLVAVLLAATCGLFAAETPAEKLYLWKATSPTNTVYLFGTIHLGVDSMYPLADEINAAFESSKVLAVEADTRNEARAQQVMLQKAVFKGDGPLDKVVSKKTLDLLGAWAQKRGVPLIGLQMFRPWAVAMSVAMVEAQQCGMKPELGLDKHLLDKAAGKKTIVELESIEGQLDMLASFPADVQETFLAETLKQAANSKEELEAMLAAWKNGDPDGMVKVAITKPLERNPEFKAVNEKFLDDRNIKMVEKIDVFLKGKDPHFVAVGAAHLVGEKGLVKLLQAKGYTVEQVTRKPAAK